MKLPTAEVMRENLLKTWHEATEAEIAEGLSWYPKAQEIMKEWALTYKLDVSVVAAVTAALSPQLRWERNLIVADDVLAGRQPSIRGVLFLEKAQAVLSNHIIDTRWVFKDGIKVYNFNRNLMGDMFAVTVDTHAAQAAVGSPAAIWIKPKQYATIADVYRELARELHLTPAGFQAIIWVVWKRMWSSSVKRALTKGGRKVAKGCKSGVCGISLTGDDYYRALARIDAMLEDGVWGVRELIELDTLQDRVKRWEAYHDSNSVSGE